MENESGKSRVCIHTNHQPSGVKWTCLNCTLLEAESEFTSHRRVKSIQGLASGQCCAVVLVWLPCLLFSKITEEQRQERRSGSETLARATLSAAALLHGGNQLLHRRQSPPRPHGDWFLVTHTREWNWWVRRARLSPPLAGVVAQPPCLQCFLHECVCACVFVLSIMIFIACSVVRVLVIFWDPVRLFMEDLKKHLFLNILINLYPAKLLYSNHSARWCVTPCRVSSYG